MSVSWVTSTRVRPRVAPQGFEQGDDLVAGVDVEVAGRLVSEEDRGIFDQYAGDPDPLLLASGQLRGQVASRAP